MNGFGFIFCLRWFSIFSLHSILLSVLFKYQQPIQIKQIKSNSRRIDRFNWVLDLIYFYHREKKKSFLFFIWNSKWIKKSVLWSIILKNDLWWNNFRIILFKFCIENCPAANLSNIFVFWLSFFLYFNLKMVQSWNVLITFQRRKSRFNEIRESLVWIVYQLYIQL